MPNLHQLPDICWLPAFGLLKQVPIHWEGTASPPGEIPTSGQFLVSVQPNVYMLGWWEETGVATKKQMMTSHIKFETTGQFRNLKKVLNGKG